MAEEQNNVAPEPPRSIRRKLLHFIVGALTLLVLLGVLFCHHAGIRSTSDVVAYRVMHREHFPPIWKDLARGRIKKGDSVESVLQRAAPWHREDAGSYTSLAWFTRGLGQREVTVIAKNGKVIAARASKQPWQHVFFESPEEGETFGHAWIKFREQRELEADAYKIHRAVTTGQDIFLSDHVERREVPAPAPAAEQDPEMMRQLREIYGERYMQLMTASREELAVEVTEVLSGDLQRGTVLMFEDTYRTVDEKGDVFLHFDDDRMLYSHARGEPYNRIVSRSALDWYQSLTPEQIQELEARWSGK